MERWERRARKIAKRREAMQVSGAGLKKVLLPLLRKRAEGAESSQSGGARTGGKPRRKGKKG